jgi:hypothetical protein
MFLAGWLLLQETFVEQSQLDGSSYSTKKTRRKGIINIDHKQYPELHTYITKRYSPALEEERKIKVPDIPTP